MRSRRKLPRNSSRMKLGRDHSAWREASATFRDSRSLTSGALPVIPEPPFTECSFIYSTSSSQASASAGAHACRTRPAPSGGSDELLEPAVVPEGSELRLDARARDREPPAHPDGAGEAAQGLLGLTAEGVDARHVETGEGVVGAEAQPLLEARERQLEGRPRRLRGAQMEEGGADPLVQLDGRALAQRVVHLLEEGPLPLEVLEGLRMPALERGQVAQPHVGAHDDHPVAAGLHALLQGGRLPRRRLAPPEVAAEGGAVGELERGPT